VHALPTDLDGPVLIQPQVHGDERGFFVETFRESVFRDLGVTETWVQDNHSRSRRGVLRGMHYQPGMAKLVRCGRGSIVDVLVDIRRGSPDFGRWESFELDDERQRQLYCPDGFAHGFCVLSAEADVIYRCSAYYDPANEAGIHSADPDLAIAWPEIELVVSERDRAAPRLAEVADGLPFT
jgi:dTDP-4-dehydrorhamnose 3,5-epimerase